MDTKLFKYIAVAYKLYADIDDENQLVEEATENQPYQYISGMGMNLPAFENAIEGMGKDDSFDFTIPQAEAYGEYVDERVVELDKEIFKVDGKIDPKYIYEDAIVPLMNEDGNRFMGRIVEIGDDNITVDLNHPLAGLDLHFMGKVGECRDATNAEIERMAKILSGEGCGGCSGGNCGDCGQEGSCGGCGGC